MSAEQSKTSSAAAAPGQQAQVVDIRPLLQRLWPDPARENETAHEISEAIAHIFVGGLSPVQTGSLLTALHFTAWDRRADVLAEASAAMRRAAATVDLDALRAVVADRGRPEGSYRGGLVSSHPQATPPTRSYKGTTLLIYIHGT